jgi:uncharacterized membrane protein YhaH (DUF805 family)
VSDALSIAVVTVLGVVLAGVIAGMVTLAIALVRWHADNRRLWLWNRQLVDHIYRGSPPPPPPPPTELFD